MRSLYRVIISTLIMLTTAGAAVHAGDVLTIAGNVGATNRAQYEPFRDALFKYHGRTFDKAFGFDLAALRSLPQHEVHARGTEWPRAIRGKGPALSDVLKLAKVPVNAKLTIVSLDGYAAEMSPADLSSRRWILTIEADGRPLTLGGRGPAWVMYDTNGKPVSSDNEGKWVWGAFMIVAE